MHRQVLALRIFMSPAQNYVARFATAFLALHFHVLFVASAAALEVLDYSNAEVQCSTGSGLVAALMDPTVSSVALLSDVKLEDADFPSSTGAGTASGELLLLDRNFSIRGVTEGRPVVLDFNYLRTKIILNGPIRLVFRNLFMVNLRRGSATQQPGYDILTVMPPSAGQRVPIVEIRESALVYRYCFPPAIAAMALKNVARPVEVEPANTTAVLPFATPFVCSQYTSSSPVVVLGSAPPPAQQRQEVNDTVSAMSALDNEYYQSIWARYGCFKTASLLADVAAYGGDMKEDNTPKSDCVKYPLHSIETTALCSDVLSNACVERSGPLGCLLLTERLPRLPPPETPSPLPPPLPPPAVAAIILPPPSSSSSRSVILGCTLGGMLALAVVIFGVLVFLRWRQVCWWRPRSACSSAAQHAKGKSDDSGSANAFAAPGSMSDPPSEPLLWAKNASVSPPGSAPHFDGKTLQIALHGGRQQKPGEAPDIQAGMAAATAGATGMGRLQPAVCAGVPSVAVLAAADSAIDSTLHPATQGGAELAAPAADTAGDSGLNDTAGRTLTIDAGSWLYSSSPEDLMPVTHLTPLQPDINLDVRPDEAALQLTSITLGKGASGRVVEGVYEGRRVAVKIIDHGLIQGRPLPPPMSPSKAAAAVALVVVAPSVRAQSDISNRDNGASGQPPTTSGAEAIGRSAAAATDVRLLPNEQHEQRPEADCSSAILPAQCSIRASASGGGGIGGKEGIGGKGDMLQGPAVAQDMRVAAKLAYDDGGSAAASMAESVTLISMARGDVVSFITAAGAVTTAGDVGSPPDTDGGAASEAGTSNPATCLGAGDEEEGDGEGMFSAESAADHYSTFPAPRQQCAEQKGNDTAAAHPAPAASAEQAPGQRDTRECLDSMLMQEVEVLARCQHPNIVRLLAACLKPPRFCLVMELMDTSLDRLLHRGGITLLPLETVLHIAIQVSQGLAYLHPTIVHRDLKPGNVLISHVEKDRPVVKLADFGLSRLRDTVLVTRNPEVGTVPYIAPEAFDVLNNRITDRVDVYAFGVILWEMLSGRRPWHRVNMVAIAVNVSIMRRRPPLDALSEGRCPPKLRALIESCWEQIPERRPASAEVVKLLALIQAETRLPADSKGSVQASVTAEASSRQ